MKVVTDTCTHTFPRRPDEVKPFLCLGYDEMGVWHEASCIGHFTRRCP